LGFGLGLGSGLEERLPVVPPLGVLVRAARAAADGEREQCDERRKQAVLGDGLAPILHG
jgi:hypothetical protein